MSTGLIAFLLFVVAFIARALNSDLDAGDWVLWAIAGLAVMNLAPVVVRVRRRQPARAE